MLARTVFGIFFSMELSDTFCIFNKDVVYSHTRSSDKFTSLSCLNGKAKIIRYFLSADDAALTYLAAKHTRENERLMC